jgi:uncharacterized protein YjbI with pentapeptide repeats
VNLVQVDLVQVNFKQVNFVQVNFEQAESWHTASDRIVPAILFNFRQFRNVTAKSNIVLF